MNLSEAYEDRRDPWSHQEFPFSNFPSIEEAFEDLKKTRTVIVELNTSQEDNTLQPESIDAIKIVTLFKQQQKEHKCILEEIEEIQQQTKAIHVSYEEMNNNSREYNNFPCIQDESIELKKIVDEMYEKYRDARRKLNISIISDLEQKLYDLKAKASLLEDNMAATRKLVLLGMEMFTSEQVGKKNICPICFDEEVGIVLIPCGHTGCTTCMTKLYNGRCMTCRTSIKSKNVVYFST